MSLMFEEHAKRRFALAHGIKHLVTDRYQSLEQSKPMRR